MAAVVPPPGPLDKHYVIKPEICHFTANSNTCAFLHLSKQVRQFCTKDEGVNLVFPKAKALELLGNVLAFDNKNIKEITNFWSTHAVRIIIAVAITAAALFLIPNSGFLFIALKVVLLLGVIVFFIALAVGYSQKDKVLAGYYNQKAEVEKYIQLLSGPQAADTVTVKIESIEDLTPSTAYYVTLNTEDCPLKLEHPGYLPPPVPALPPVFVECGANFAPLARRAQIATA